MRGLIAALAILAAVPAHGQGAGSTVPETGGILPTDEQGWPLYPDPNSPRGGVPADERPMGEQVVAGLSNASVSITTNFDGSEILIYGAIKREEPAPDGALDVIVTIEAPSQPATVWRKARRFGIWVNTDSVRIGAAPSFYAVATSGPLERILDPAWDSRYRVSLPQALRAFADRPDVEDTLPYTEAMIRLRRQNGHYRLDESSVTLVEDTLFRTDIRLPANLIEGDYKTRIFLLREGRVIDVYRAGIEVRKVGVERWLYNLAFQQPLIYGLMSLAVAVAAGWGASAAFRRLRRT